MKKKASKFIFFLFIINSYCLNMPNYQYVDSPNGDESVITIFEGITVKYVKLPSFDISQFVSDFCDSYNKQDNLVGCLKDALKEELQFDTSFRYPTFRILGEETPDRSTTLFNQILYYVLVKLKTKYPTNIINFCQEKHIIKFIETKCATKISGRCLNMIRGLKNNIETLGDKFNRKYNIRSSDGTNDIYHVIFIHIQNLLWLKQFNIRTSDRELFVKPLFRLVNGQTMMKNQDYIFRHLENFFNLFFYIHPRDFIPLGVDVSLTHLSAPLGAKKDDQEVEEVKEDIHVDVASEMQAALALIQLRTSR